MEQEKNVEEMDAKPLTFDEILSDKEYQSEFDKRLSKALETVKKGMPTKEELKEYNEYKQSLKTKEEKDKETIEDLTKTKNENLTMKQQLAIIKKGIVDDDTVEFIQFKIGKLEGDFSENLEKFLTDNPKYTTKEEPKKVTTGYKQTTSAPVSEKQDYLTNKYKNNPYFKG